jgi:predicted unusual protein kinase regulating ubiquinone biosynthesis (AarF/ABC1/UbiB family)
MFKPFIIGVGYNLVPAKKRGDWLRMQLEKSGPAYIKMGQFISNRSDIFGKDVSVALKSLKDDVEPIKIPLPMDMDVESKPFATASIAQVYRGKINGKVIAIKMKKPGISNQIKKDVNGIRTLLNFFNCREVKFLDEFEKTLNKELDFRSEVDNIIEFQKIYDGTNVIVPRVYTEHCTDDMIVMDYLPSDGGKINSKFLISLFVEQLLFENIIHGDLHSGNIGIIANKVVLYDFGNVIRTTQEYRNFTRDFVYYVQAKDNDNVLLTMRNMGMTINNVEMTRLFISKLFKYLDTLDIKSFRFDIDEVQDKIPVELDSTTTTIMRSFALLEGYCKDEDPSFSYEDTLMSSIELLYIDIDYIMYRAKKDLDTFRI